jgi:hypothetical protein
MEIAENKKQGQDSHVVFESQNEQRVNMKAQNPDERMHPQVCELKIGGWRAPEDEIPKGGWRGPEDEIPKGGWRGPEDEIPEGGWRMN